MKRIILHWTGGAYYPSDFDKEFYHYLIDKNGKVHLGKHGVQANANLSGKTSKQYAAHTANCNTGSIGIALCAMGGKGVNESNWGNVIITAAQLKALFELAANLSDEFGIAITPSTVLTHAEVEPTLGIKQNSKWDIRAIPSFSSKLLGAREAGDMLRAHIVEQKEKKKSPPMQGGDNILKMIMDIISKLVGGRK